MKTKVLITSLAVLFLGSLMLYAAEGDKPAAAPKDKPAAKAPKQGQKLNQQQRLEKWMAQINKAYKAKDYQKVEQLIKQYANAGQNRPGPAAGQKQMQQRRMNQQQDRPFARGQGRQQGPAGWQDQNLPDRPRAQAPRPGQGHRQAMAPRQGQQFRHGRPMDQRPAPYAQADNFKAKMRHWAMNHPQEFKQFLNQYCSRPGRWNQQMNAGPQRNRPNPGYWRNFWADEF
jgi:hypothetical protein